MKKSLIVVDCQYDFIDGSLACLNAENAVNNIINFVNSNDLKVVYSMDWHSNENKSFEVNGGIWPIHCVRGERGSQIHEDFAKLIVAPENKPDAKNAFKKGQDDEIEEYSAYYARNEDGTQINEYIDKEVVVSGIASEFCVRETILELLKNGFKVELLESGIGYVDEKEHHKNLAELKELGVTFV